MYMECSGSEDYYFDDAKFFDLSSDFISKNNDDEIEEVYLCHLIRSIDRPDKLYPLHEVLTTQNSFSDFLRQEGFCFKISDQKIHLIFDGKEYSEIELGTPVEDKNYYGHLAVRFGYDDDPDYCLNGFLFAINPERSTDGYYDLLKRGPEVLQDIDKLFDTNLSSTFYKISNYYFALIRVDLNQIMVPVHVSGDQHLVAREVFFGETQSDFVRCLGCDRLVRMERLHNVVVLSAARLAVLELGIHHLIEC